MNTGICQLAYLLAIEAIPAPAVELLVEIKNELGMDKVDESVSHVACIIVIDGKIKEVDFEPMILAYFLKQHFF